MEIAITLEDIHQMLDINPVAKLQVENFAHLRRIAELEATLAESGTALKPVGAGGVQDSHDKLADRER